MNRSFISVMIVVLLCTFIPAFTDVGIDLSTMSDTELVELFNAVSVELNDRDLNNSILSGIYTIGKDIKAGKYQFDCKAKSGAFIMHLYKNEADFAKTNYIDAIMCDVGGSVFLSLDDNIILVLHEVVEGDLKSVSASWMP